jgi:zinc-ribbon domain
VPVCVQCGQENPDVAKFCLACGAPIVVAEAPAAVAEERKLITAVFCDLVGSTARSKSLDVEDVKSPRKNGSLPTRKRSKEFRRGYARLAPDRFGRPPLEPLHRKLERRQFEAVRLGVRNLFDQRCGIRLLEGVQHVADR